MVAALALTILLKAFVVQVFSIPSGSMENTLLPGDRILVSKIVYRLPAHRARRRRGVQRRGLLGPAPRRRRATRWLRLWDDAVEPGRHRRAGHRLRQARDRHPRRPRGLLRRRRAGSPSTACRCRESSYIYPGDVPVRDAVQHHRPGRAAVGDGGQPGATPTTPATARPTRAAGPSRRARSSAGPS